MSKTNSLHYNLCVAGAKWLHSRDWKLARNGEELTDPFKIVAVELVSLGVEKPDVWGTNGFYSAVIEVKVSRSDFVRDKKKLCRRKEKYACGNIRYYLTPKGLIDIAEIPDEWGLLEYDKGNITVTKKPLLIECSNYGDLCMLSSIARREGVKNKIYNYRIK